MVLLGLAGTITRGTVVGIMPILAKFYPRLTRYQFVAQAIQAPFTEKDAMTRIGSHMIMSALNFHAIDKMIDEVEDPGRIQCAHLIQVLAETMALEFDEAYHIARQMLETCAVNEDQKLGFSEYFTTHEELLNANGFDFEGYKKRTLHNKRFDADEDADEDRLRKEMKLVWDTVEHEREQKFERQLEEGTPSTSSSAPSLVRTRSTAIFVWEFDAHVKSESWLCDWKQYDPVATEALEAMFLKYREHRLLDPAVSSAPLQIPETKYHVEAGNWHYEVDVATMTQTNKDIEPYTQRAVRRRRWGGVGDATPRP